jgi:hypothetical protein
MIKLQRIVCPTDLSEDSERTIRYAVALTRASGAKLFLCYRPKTPADQEWALATIQKLITAGLSFPSGGKSRSFNHRMGKYIARWFRPGNDNHARSGVETSGSDLYALAASSTSCRNTGLDGRGRFTSGTLSSAGHAR